MTAFVFLWSQLDEIIISEVQTCKIHSYLPSILHIFIFFQIAAFKWSTFCFEFWSMSVMPSQSWWLYEQVDTHYLPTTLQPATANASRCALTSEVSHFFHTATCMYCSSSREEKCQWGFIWYLEVFLTTQKNSSMLTWRFRPVICITKLYYPNI